MKAANMTGGPTSGHIGSKSDKNSDSTHYEVGINGTRTRNFRRDRAVL